MLLIFVCWFQYWNFAGFLYQVSISGVLWVFYILTHVICGRLTSCFSVLMPLIFSSCLLALVRIAGTLLSGSRGSDVSCLLELISRLPFRSSFHHEGMLNFTQYLFCIYWDEAVVFVFHLVHVWLLICICWILHLYNESYWVMANIFSTGFVCEYFMEGFFAIFIKIIGLHFLLCFFILFLTSGSS